MNEYSERKRRMAERHGWRPSTTPRACPRYAAGKRCLYYGRPSGKCVCQLIKLDHAACWVGEDGERIFTFEPYSLCGEDIVCLVDALNPLGLELDVSGRSGWYPGETALIMIRRTDAVAEVG